MHRVCHQVSYFTPEIIRQLLGIRSRNNIMIGITAKIPSRKKMAAKIRLTMSRRHRNNDSIFLSTLNGMENFGKILNVLWPLELGPKQPSISRYAMTSELKSCFLVIIHPGSRFL